MKYYYKYSYYIILLAVSLFTNNLFAQLPAWTTWAQGSSGNITAEFRTRTDIINGQNAEYEINVNIPSSWALYTIYDYVQVQIWSDELIDGKILDDKYTFTINNVGNGFNYTFSGRTIVQLSFGQISSKDLYAKIILHSNMLGYNTITFNTTPDLHVNIWKADTYDPNESFAAASDLGSTNTAIGPLIINDDNDFYKISISSTSFNRLLTKIDFQNDGGDLDLYLYNSGYIQIGSSVTLNNVESIDKTDLPLGTYYIVVRQKNSGTKNWYDLNISHLPPPPVTISGYVRDGSGNGISGVAVTFSNSGGTATTNSTGYYSQSVSYGYTGTATPSLSGWTFSQPSRSYTNVTSNLTNQNYTGTHNPVSISGYVRDGSGNGISGVAVTFSNSGGTTTTNSTGYYSQSVSYGYTGTATPSLSGWTFSQPSRSYTNVTSNLANQNYTGTHNPVSISGYVRDGSGNGINGVTVTFSNTGGTTTTNSTGYYSQSVSYGYSGTATPSLSGWTFTQPNLSYSNVTSNLTNQNYTGTHNPVSISGYVRDGSGNGISGVAVTFSNSGGTATTNSTGYYSQSVSYGYTGTATPSLSGWTFSQPSRSYTNVTSNLANQNYTGTHNPVSISGYVRDGSGNGINGVTVTFSNTGGTTTTNSTGYYSQSVSYGYSGTATPSLSGWTFTQPNLSYSNVTSNLTNQNYTGTQNGVTISGYIRDGSGNGINGVTVTFSNTGGTTTTNSTGYYSQSVSYGYSGTATPSLSGWTFTQPNLSYSNVTSNLTNQNYTGTQNGVTISGYIRDGSGNGINGVTVTFSNTGGTTTTNSTGYYSQSVSYGYSGTATPSLSGWTFTQPNLSYSNVTSNLTNQNYTGTQNGVTISGYIRDGSGNGINGVTVTFSNTGGTTTTNSTGYYSQSVSYGYSGTATPSLSGWTFTQPNLSYSNVTSNLTNQNYTGTHNPVSISGYIRDGSGNGINGVTVTFSNTGGTTTTNSTGYYSQSVSYGYSGTATPSLSGWTFTQPNLSYSNVTSNLTNQNYTGTQNGVTISGYIRDGSGNGINGVTVTFSNTGGTTTTNSTGYYSQSVSYGYSGTATPSLSGWTFTQPNLSYSNVTSNLTNQNYTALKSEFADTPISIPGFSNCSVAWGDYDSDGDLDLLISGDSWSEGPISKVYKNKGNNTFDSLSISLPHLYYSSVAWGDYDNDGDLDFILTGLSYPDYAFVSKIYRNDGNDKFVPISSGLKGVQSGSVAWGDYDNDGDLDILITGNASFSSNQPYSAIYKNDGNDTFTEQTSIQLTGVSYSSVAWGDYDNDGDLDILLTGQSSGNQVSKIYKNNGDNTFTEQTSIQLAGVSYSSVAWGDYDNDGDLDILLTGNSLGNPISKIYRNNGDNTFTEQTSIQLIGVSTSSVAWGDYDNDGYLDILLTGYNGTSFSTIYRNNGNNTFTEQTSIQLAIVENSSVAWGDYNNDGKLDIILSGYNEQDGYSYTKLYANNNSVANSVPSAPTNLTSNISNGKVELGWDKSTDNETSQNGLAYNLVIGSSQNGVDVVSPMSDRTTGLRRIVNLGNTNQNNSWIINNLAPGKYYWSVQAVDNTFSGSQFATEHSFTVPSPTSHFQVVWSGTPYQAMNIFLESATLSGAQLSSGDEIAVFDGNNCVGATVLTGSVSSYVEIKASADDPNTTSTDGFISGHDISYKLWKSSSSKEYDAVKATYNPTSPNTKFSKLGTAYVNLDFQSSIAQSIQIPATPGISFHCLKHHPILIC